MRVILKSLSGLHSPSIRGRRPRVLTLDKSLVVCHTESGELITGSSFFFFEFLYKSTPLLRQYSMVFRDGPCSDKGSVVRVDVGPVSGRLTRWGEEAGERRGVVTVSRQVGVTFRQTDTVQLDRVGSKELVCVVRV